ncbi:MAG: hypothetical protein WDM86_15075 [Rhizomicrobium sp.]
MSPAFRDPLTAKIVTFLNEIGLKVRAGDVAGKTALPGIDIEQGCLVVDEERLAWPGDLLHEAGHLAVAAPDRRAAFHHDVGNDAAEEMMAIAWSYAAARHLRIDPAIVFHEGGYRGGSEAILDAFTTRGGFAVPMLDYTGMACEPKWAAERGVKPYPHMLSWLRKA